MRQGQQFWDATAVFEALASADDAERLLARIRYQAEVTLPEHVATLKDNPANLFLNIFILCLVYTVSALHGPRRLQWFVPPILLLGAVAYTFFR